MSKPERWNLRRVFRLPATRARVRADVDAELEFHIAGRIEELMAQGLSRTDAENEARRRLGDFANIEREVERVSRHTERRRTIGDHVEALVSDVRYAVRSLIRQPIFTAVVILTLTLGVGATSAIFHAVDRVVLHPLPYPNADRIAYLGTQWGKTPPIGAVAPRRFQFWHDNSRIFDALGVSTTIGPVVGDDGGAPVEGIRVTQAFLRVVGAAPIIGRSLLARDYTADAAPVVLLGHSLWVSRFGGDRSVVGHTVRLDGTTYTVVGVLPASFEIAELATPPAVVEPLVFSAKALEDVGANYTAVGLLRSGVSRKQIDDDVARMTANYRSAFPERIAKDEGDIVAMTYGQIFAPDLAPQLWIMLGATAFVFLLACANVANLVLARALTRQREFAVRAALGAGRSRIVRQIVVEMLLLGVASAAVAIPASLATVRGLVELAHRSLMRDSQLHVDTRVVVLTTLVAVGAAVLIGLVVAMATTSANFTRSLSGSARTNATGGSTSHRGVRGLLVGIESAIAVVLLAGAGLLISSFFNVLHVDGGFRREGVYTATVAHPPLDYKTHDASLRFAQQVLDNLRATPGIVDEAATVTLPLQRGTNMPTTVEGRNDLTEGASEWRAVSPSYFRTMDIRLVAGRDLSESDVAGTTPVVLVSESYVKRFFNGENPIGRRILVGCYKGCPRHAWEPAREIVGVVRDVRDMSLEQSAPRHTVWVPLAQITNDPGVPAFVVRATDPSVAATALRRAIADAEPRMGMPDVAAMSDLVSASMSWRRFSTVLMVCFAALALVLTCVGIYGAASYAVSQRVREIGIRMALGARPHSVVALVVRQGVMPAAIGLCVGLPVALALSRVLKTLLFGVGPRDPMSFAAVAIVLLGVAIVASYVPARRAARVDPARTLRME
ncbi:MAG TPA: ABC transporter permease [Gemmatimonadaceae bacterium]|jgi:predicted permease